MLRIEIDAAGTPHPRVRLTGQIRGMWVDELRRFCNELLGSGLPLELEMTDVSFVDADGVRLLHELAPRHVALRNCALFVAEQLRSLEQDA